MDGKFVWTTSYVDLPAIVIVAIITSILVIGNQGERELQCGDGDRQVVRRLLRDRRRGVLRQSRELEAVRTLRIRRDQLLRHARSGARMHNGHLAGMLAGAATIFFAYIGFDAVSTQSEEAKNPQRDVPIGIIASLIICTILYIAVAAVLTGMVPTTRSTSTHRSPTHSLRWACPGPSS